VAPELNVLISSAGRRVGLLRIFRETLRELGVGGRVLAADASAASAAFHDADEAFVVPRCSDPAFVPAMLDACRTHRVGMVIPTIDPELEIYAEHRDEFAAAAVTVCVSAPEVTRIGADKVRTHEWLASEGFPVPKQASAAEVLSNGGGWRFPLMVKPRRGSASIGVGVVRDAQELARAADDGDLVVQTISPGVEYTIDLLTDRTGRCVCAVPRRRVETRYGESHKGITVRSPELEDLAARICEALRGAYGALNVQVMVDEASGRHEVIEINPRFGGGFPLSHAAGAAFPRWLIEERLGLPSTARSDGWEDGIVMLRYDEAVFVSRPEAGL
jgi:carbamoyl-phosphate synthase large subunit